MSTHAVIAKQTPEGFTGVYHHFDGYPMGLGKYLFELYQRRYVGELTRMMKELIDDHAAGWSTIIHKEPPECFCHVAGHENSTRPLTQEDKGTVWAYVFFDDDGPVMQVWASLEGGWASVSTILLDGRAPLWKLIEDGVETLEMAELREEKISHDCELADQHCQGPVKAGVGMFSQLWFCDTHRRFGGEQVDVATRGEGKTTHGRQHGADARKTSTAIIGAWFQYKATYPNTASATSFVAGYNAALKDAQAAKTT